MDISDILISIANLVRLASSRMMGLRCGVIFFSLPAHFTDRVVVLEFCVL
jgi:hypothetical protein